MRLNEIHLALKRSQQLVRWMAESEIHSRNELTEDRYCKDYDAVVTVRNEIGERTFALEYERSPKARKEYLNTGEAERVVDRFLYLVPNYDLLSFLVGCFAAVRRPIYFGLARDFLDRRFDVPLRGTRPGAMTTDFINQVFDIQHSYYWRRGGHLIDTKSEASAQPLPMHPALKDGLLEWRSLCIYNQAGDYVFASERLKGRKPLDLASVLKKKVQPAFRRIGIPGVGWHTFRHTVGTMLAEMGQHSPSRTTWRHSNLHVTNKYLQATSKAKRLAQDKLVDAILPTGLLPAPKLIQ